MLGYEIDSFFNNYEINWGITITMIVVVGFLIMFTIIIRNMFIRRRYQDLSTAFRDGSESNIKELMELIQNRGSSDLLHNLLTARLSLLFGYSRERAISYAWLDGFGMLRNLPQKNKEASRSPRITVGSFLFLFFYAIIKPKQNDKLEGKFKIKDRRVEMNNWNIVIGIISFIFIVLVAYQTFVISRREEIGRISEEIVYLLEVLRDNSQSKTTVHMIIGFFIRKYNESIENEIPKLMLPKIFLRGRINDLLGEYKTLKDEYQAQLK